MRKVTWWTALVLVASSALTPAFADDPGASGPDPASRAGWIAPAAAGTKTTIKLQWGPYEVHPGTDIWRLHADVPVTEGFITGIRPSVRQADGTLPHGATVHIHHSGWYLRTAQAQRWLIATGEETTHIDLDREAKADPRYADGLRYGVGIHQGEALYGASMIHNKTSQPLTLWLELQVDFVSGTRETIKQATGLDYHPITADVSLVSIFNVPRVGRAYVYPRDAGKQQIWTAEQDGTMVLAAGHLHPGAREMVVSNLGTAADPCPDDGDEFPGTTVARIREFTRNNVFPSEEFTIGITKPGWRVKVHKGDRFEINTIYDATKYGYVDAMDAFGHWVDPLDPPVSGESTCSATLIDDPAADEAAIADTVPSHPWLGAPHPVCTTQCENLSAPLPPLGQHTTTITMAAFQYVPGDQATASVTGAPWVRKGEPVTFVNPDFGALIRHTATSCESPCNGAYVANYPNWDGFFDSGVLGSAAVPITGTEGFASAKQQPIGAIDTSKLEPGYYPYFCRLHPWMRGSFYVVDAPLPPPPSGSEDGGVAGFGQIPDGRSGTYAWFKIAASSGSGAIFVRDNSLAGDRFTITGSITSVEVEGSTATVRGTCAKPDGTASGPCSAIFRDRGSSGDEASFTWGAYSFGGRFLQGDVTVIAAPTKERAKA